MTFTGQFGTANSSLGNIVLGYPGIASSVPVTPPTGTTMLPDLQLIVNFGANKRILNGVGANSVTDSIHWGSLMPGGHHTLEARIADTERSGHTNVYRYGATVTLRERSTTAEGGQILWQGYLRTPTANDDGTCDLVCNGWHQLLQERDEALLWQDRYYGEWQPADAEGFRLGGTSDSIDASVNNSSLVWSVKAGTDISDGDKAKLVWYYNDAIDSSVLPRRVAGTLYKNRQIASGGPFVFALEHYDSPEAGHDGRVRDFNFDAQLANNNTGDDGSNFAQDIAQNSPHPVVALSLYRDGGAATVATNFKIKISNLRVNDIAPGDSYVSSSVVRDVAARIGFTSGSKIVTTTDNILPLFWDSGTWWDLIDYISTAEKMYKWAVWEQNPNPEVEFEPWGTGGTTWTANGYSSSATVIAKLQPDDEVYNCVDVAYRKGNSLRWRHARWNVVPDPFRDLNPWRLRAFKIVLQDPQPDGIWAGLIAFNLASELATEQLAGTVIASYLSIGSTAHSVYECRAGDLLTLPDYPGGSKTVRIYGVDHRDDGPSTLTIGRVPSHIDRFLWWLDRNRRRSGKEPS